MKHPAALLTILLAALLSGCDGRGKILYLRPATAMKPPWSVASVVIPIQESEDVLGIVTKVAADLGMIPDPNNKSRWSILLSERNTFMLSAQKETGGYWTVNLMDWPSIQRSPQSLKAETAIREALKRPNQALEHNDPSRHASCCAPVAPTGIVAHL
jgi:hypothetical protein